MLCTNCKTELPSNAEFCPECGTAVPKQTGLQIDQEADTVKGAVTGLAAADGAKDDKHEVNTGGGDYGHEVSTGGGAFVGLGGRVDTGGGDFVGRDQVKGLGGEDIAGLFAAVYQKIEARPQDPNVDKE